MNVVHSIDAYLLRTVVRKCMYDPKVVSRVLKAADEPTYTQTTDPVIDKANTRYLATGMADISIINHLNEDNIHLLECIYLTNVVESLNKMCQYTPFEVTTIHDS